MPRTRAEIFEGVLIGTAVGDSLGLPHEGLHPGRIARRLDRGGLRHAMFRGRGLLSDDTEHAAAVARALAVSGGDLGRFERAFARELRRWFSTLPPGIGLGTLRACLRLCVGLGPKRSGVNSAGNGPAMRAPLLGVWARDDAQLCDLVRSSTRITHTDSRAEQGARLVARLTRSSAALDGLDVESAIKDVRDAELRDACRLALECTSEPLDAYRDRANFARGVSGFVVHTVPAAVYVSLRHRAAPTRAIEDAIRLGGDTDTVGAIVGAIVGAAHGADAWPNAWVDGIRDWPLTNDSLCALARHVTDEGHANPPSARRLAALVRNLAVIPLLFGHIGLRWLGR